MILRLSALILAIVLAGCCAAPSTGVYYNGKIYTADQANPSATAFVVKDGNFVYVGDDRGALAYGPGVDLDGKRVVPGMIDSHCHPVMTAALASLDPIMLDGKMNLEEALATLKRGAADSDHSRQPFIFGFGFGTACRPVRAVDLDQAVPDRPAVVFSDDGHALWINTKAMQLAKLTKNTPDPVPGGSYFERDSEGNPTGFVVETTAGFLLLRQLGIFTAKDVEEQLPKILKMFASKGITGIFEAGFAVIGEADGLEALRQLEKKDKLTMRFFTSYFYFGPPTDTPEKMIKIMRANHRKYHTDLVHADTLKMIADGTLEVQSAWMHEDYLPPAKGRGGPLLRYKDMLPAAQLAAAEGFNIHSHAIGDAAVTEALDYQRDLGKIKGTKTICHVQVLPKNGVKRFAEQDSFYQTTPCWLGDDDYTADILGKERYLRQVPLASLLKGGVKLTFGSDFPVSGGEAGVDPFLNTWFAVNRKTNDEIAPPKEEAIGVKECIDAYTINGAEQLGAATRFGSITVGKSADFVVCSDDVLSIEPEKLKDVSVEETWFRGKCVYRKPNFLSFLKP